MTTILKIKRLVTIFLILVILPIRLLAQPVPEMITFGDSLSDAGNFFVTTGEVVRKPYEPIPGAPYTVGGHHFSNGQTWVEQLARTLRIKRDARPATRRPGRFFNYAFGRSRARAGAPTFSLVDLSTQVRTFLGDFGGSAPSDARYMVFIGSNDARDALIAGTMDPGQVPLIIGAAILATSDNIVTLWSAGARTFVVLNIPNLAITPAVRALGPDAEAAALFLTLNYNAALEMALQALEGALPGIQITRVDTFTLLNDVVADPDSAGLTNVTDPCLSFGVIGGAICSTPNRYLFWDAAHPTRAGHAVLADEVAQVLGGP